MLVANRFFTAMALATLLAGCGDDQAVDGDTARTTIARSDIPAESGNDLIVVDDEATRDFENGVSDFEGWSISTGVTVDDSVEIAPDGSRTADLLRLGENGVVGRAIAELDVEPGDTIEAGVWLWAEANSEAVLQLVSWCSDTEPEVATEVVSVSAEPARFPISHTFEYAHECVRFQIVGSGTDTNVYAWNALVARAN